MAAVPAWQVALTVFSTAVGVAGAAQSASAARAVAKQNAETEAAAAGQARLAGQAESASHKVKVAKLIGRQRAAMGGSGLLVDDGSNLLIQQDTAGLAKEDTINIEANAYRRAFGHEQQAESLLLGGEYAKSRSQGKIFGTVAGGASELGYLQSQYS